MSRPLAVTARRFGTRSETFIRRHVRDLLPGGTVALELRADDGRPRDWEVGCPVFSYDAYSGAGWFRKGMRLASAGAGLGDPFKRGLERFLRQQGVEVVMGEYLDVSLPLLDLVKGMGLRFFAHAHGSDVSVRLREPEMRERFLAYNRSDGVLCMSENCRLKLERIGIDPARLHVARYGVDVPGAVPDARASAPQVNCLAVGRMVAKKAPILLLDAFRRAAEREPGLRLEVVGSGELFPSALHFVDAFQLGERVTLHGAVPSAEVATLLGRADIFVQHSVVDPVSGDEEGLPVAVLEAMAAALPVVSTRHSGIPEAVEDGVTGFLVEAGDSAGMGERIAALVADDDLRRRMGRAGWKRARERFSWERERADLLRIMGLGGGVSPS